LVRQLVHKLVLDGFSVRNVHVALLGTLLGNIHNQLLSHILNNLRFLRLPFKFLRLFNRLLQQRFVSFHLGGQLSDLLALAQEFSVFLFDFSLELLNLCLVLVD